MANPTDLIGDKVNRTQQLQSKLKQSATQLKLLRYPLNLGDVSDGLGSYILFNINVTSGSRFVKSYGNGSFDSSIEDTDGNIIQTAGEKRNRSSVGILQGGTKRIDTAIMLYMPPTMEFNQSVNWETADLDRAARLANSTSSFANAISNAGKVSDLGSFFASALGNAFNDAKRSASSAMETIGIEGARNLYDASRREIINPHTEVIFKGIDKRTFQMEFKLTPKNKEEAAEIANIIKAFRFHAAPELKGGKETGRYMVYPSEFNIYFYQIQQGDGRQRAVENPFIPKISTCVLKSISNPLNSSGNWIVSEDGAPMENTLTLEFQELETLTKDKIDAGY